MASKCPTCHSEVPPHARKCRHCHNYLGFSFAWVWEEGIRMLSLVAAVAAAFVAWKSLELTQVAQTQRAQAVAETQLSNSERDALKEDFSASTGQDLSFQDEAIPKQEKSLLQAAADTSDLRVRKVLGEALKFKRAKVPFRMGGKSPEEGFDSSGFISFLLGEAGVLDPLYHRTFSVAKLEKSFPEVDAKKAKPGDLVFLGASFVAILLENGKAVGIGNKKGIQVFTFYPHAKKSYRRWAYEQEIKQLK